MPRSESSVPQSLVRSAKPYTRPTNKLKKYTDVDIESDDPGAGTPSSDDGDDGSVFTPRNRTPMNEVASPSDEKDIKPSIRDASEEEDEDEEIKPNLKKPKKSPAKKSPKTPSTPKVKNETTSTPSPRKNNGVKAPGRTWSAQEDWKLFREMHPKVDKANWGGVASAIGNGRDAKSCQNRYAVLSKRLEGAIKGIGGG
nr:uncharacterized protein CI109_002678 [Kwoniella shandongensis]KAA5528921.1 hypothetical protein CI109_002678 [Kwoniella shandongensis]